MGSHPDGRVAVLSWLAATAFSRSVFGWLLLQAFGLEFISARGGVEHKDPWMPWSVRLVENIMSMGLVISGARRQ